ncbi:UDP-2,4-diacetamido-2,4,6-trideoxy-beta-L-altropyranose hydrolase [Thalassotalea insulae]|uniref:UDP-2,4-diacetamido-2,4, 6-trideoxy-beta-L-altropyranose hydrolase n=1 Tax=Thalassotalea insulae TaxID=2056778 RepID=A0ABQ6GR17_9GAMM|nr:UDP-2,4-diacetamido-2,4,6-trideoxy-beta-L-altropyranose hydrolase [Thalassotalea insulae]GLX77634.1 UDP-2,4-diacetamido-2,4,6-trideoxy-beta-L-altropyranose hydrolase [Thalassotalea insulae]
MKIAFRVDASNVIGIGHVMRCLTLAKALTERGAEICFISRILTGHIFADIIAAGYQVYPLPKPRKKIIKSDTSTWLGESFDTEIEQISPYFTTSSIKSNKVDLLIVDHYAIDKYWHQAMRPYCQKLMVIDDLANREYDCDILLDQTLNRQATSYKNLVPNHCLLMLGQAYMLLREEFSLWREQAQIKRKKANLTTSSILLMLGGSDPLKMVTETLSAFGRLQKEGKNSSLTIILPSNIQFSDRVHEKIKGITNIQLIIGSDNVAELMYQADIAIGSCGSVSWERCSLGLPTLSIVTAENQITLNQELNKQNAVLTTGLIDEINATRIYQNLMVLLNDNTLYQQLSRNAFTCCDANGSRRVTPILIGLNQELTLRPATALDKELLFSWQRQESIRQYSNTPKPPSWHEHSLWFDKCILDKNKELFILTLANQQAVGMIRLDKSTPIEVKSTKPTHTISIIIDPQFQGKKLGLLALKTLIKQKPNSYFLAQVHPENVPSNKLFLLAGFTKISTDMYQHST